MKKAFIGMFTIAIGGLVGGMGLTPYSQNILYLDNQQEVVEEIEDEGESVDSFSEIEINETNFPDKYFREYITEICDGKYGGVEDGILSDVEISNTTLITPYGIGGLESIKGIEYFTELEELTCYDLNLTEVDLSNNKKLKILHMQNNMLSDIDLSENKELEYVDLSNNQLSTLDFSNNSKLKSVYIRNNNLAYVNLTNCAEIQNLYADNNFYKVEFNADGEFDLNAIPGIDVSKVSNVTNGTMDGTIVTKNADADYIEYTYDCGEGKKLTFSLKEYTYVEELNLQEESVSITRFGAYRLKPTVSPEDATDDSLIWKSSNNDVASVNNVGTIIANSPGTATITCTTKDGSNLSCECVVTVTSLSDYASTITPDLTKATFDYLNEIYIERYPDMGTEFMYGTDNDRKILQNVADRITEGCGTQEGKAQAISQWIKNNIVYQSGREGATNYYPMDVLREKKGNCLGYAELAKTLMRLSGVPAVVVIGSVGDMSSMTIEGIALDKYEAGHAWLMVYYNGDWYRYDPLFSVYGNNNRNDYAQTCFSGSVEGVMISYDGMDKTVTNMGTGVFYEDSKFFSYTSGLKASEYYGTGAESKYTVNNQFHFVTKTRYEDSDCSDGYNYLVNPSRKDDMENDQCYADGWISIGDIYLQTRPNGILNTNNLIKEDGKTYLIDQQGAVCEIETVSDSSKVTFYKSGIAIQENAFMDFAPTWLESELDNGREVVWTSDNPDIASVDQDGVVTGLKKGEAYITVYSRNPGESYGGYAQTTVFVCVTGDLSYDFNEDNQQEPGDEPNDEPGDEPNDEPSDEPGDEPSDVPQNVPADIISYCTHVQSFGWQNYVVGGGVSGTEGASKRLEGIKIKINDGYNVGVRYKTHVQSYGWQEWVQDDAMSGTEGEAKRLEAISIELTGTDKEKYDIYYRVHAQSYGWLGWAKNGSPAGTAGQAKRLEAIQIQVLPKGVLPKEGIVGYSYIEEAKKANNGTKEGMVNYSTHVQSYGDQSYVYDGSVSGTFGEAKRLEGIKINLNNDLIGLSGGITYSTHVQTYGWLDWSANGEFNGTQGEAKRLEAIKIKLNGDVASKYDIYYRVHAQTYGWLGWAKNGESSGTAGFGKRLEAIQIVILPKGSQPPSILPASGSPQAFIQK